ncbi:MAG: PH domain-containing protein [Oscillospiraceae bacterium]|nr:PH domain-containing protein [Oscillospiraceae bacterium]
MTERHTHPITLLQMIWRFLFLLIFPAARGFLTALSGGNVTEWLGGAWKDILIIVAILFLAFLQWWCLRYRWEPVGLSIRKGVLFRQRMFIPAAKIITMSLTRPFYLKPVGGVRLRVDTWAGASNSTDISLTLPRKAAEDILSKRESCLTHADFAPREYHPKGLYIACLSAILSSSFAGVLFFATFISQTGSLLGQEFADRITGTFERLTRTIAWGLPPATVALAYLIIFGWLYSFLRNLIRHKNFVLHRRKSEFMISSGIITNRSYSIRLSEINYIDIRQSLVTKLLGLYSVFINAVGYGKEKDDISAMIPANPWDRLQRHLHFLLPEFAVSPRQVKSNGGAIFRFILDPLIPTLTIPAAGAVLATLFPSWADFTYSIVWMAMIPCLWFLTVRFLDFFSSGVGRQGDMFTLRYSSGSQLHTVILPLARISQVVLRQSPIQAFDRRCDVFVYSTSEKKTQHHLRNLDLAQVMEIFGCNETNALPFPGWPKPLISLTEYLHPFSNYLRQWMPFWKKQNKNGTF